MRRATFIEVLNEADKLADDELLLCTFEIAKYIEVEIEVNNERLLTSARLRSRNKPGLTITEFYHALSISINGAEDYYNWEVIKIVRVGSIDPNYP